MFSYYSRSEQLLESLGPFSQKLVVQASDDVYQATLVKMNMAEQESKKVWYAEVIFDLNHFFAMRFFKQFSYL